MSLSPDFKERILASVSAVPAPTRQQVWRTRAWLMACGIAGALAIFLLEGGVRASERPPSLVALTSVGTVVIVAAGAWFLFTRGSSMLGRPLLVLVAVGVVSSLLFVAWRYVVSGHYGHVAPWPERPGFRCLSLGVATGLPPLLAALLSWRHGHSITPVTTGAAFGAGAGLSSALLVDLWCPVSYLPHLLLGHLLPIGLLSVVGGFLGWHLLRLGRR